jgi:hypothetical protein
MIGIGIRIENTDRCTRDNGVLPHGADEKVRADVPGLEERDEELAELFVPLLLLGPVVFALVLTRLLLVARHHNNLRDAKQQA